MHSRLFIAAAALLALAPPVLAQPDDIFGNWSRGDGAARVKVAPCGGNICAINTWIKDPAGQKEKVGDRLIFTNLTFSAKLKATGDSMVTTGCIVGGLICRSTRWTKN